MCLMLEGRLGQPPAKVSHCRQVGLQRLPCCTGQDFTCCVVVVTLDACSVSSTSANRHTAGGEP